MSLRILSAVAASAALCAFTLSAPATAQEAIRLGTSSVGSTMYTIGVGMSKIIQEHGGLNVAVESLGGSHANMFGVARGKADFAMANSGATFDLYHGNPPFKKPFELRLVAQGNPNYRGIFVTVGSGINKPEDLVGRTIMAKRKPLPELEKLFDAVVKVYGLPKNKIKVVSSRNLGEVNRMLRAGSVEAAAYPFSERQPVISKLFHDKIVRPMIFSEDKYDAMKKLLPKSFYKYYFPANTWDNQPEAFFTFVLSTQLVTAAKQNADRVYAVTKALLGHTKEFSKYHGSARHWNIKKTLSEPAVPFHEGSIRYFKEIGMWTPALAATQAELLARK